MIFLKFRFWPCPNLLAFTIASAPTDENMCFYIKAVGDWTKALRVAFQERIEGIETEPICVEVRGPYGAPSQHVGGFQRVVLISGGVGATPFCSISKYLYHRIVQNENMLGDDGTFHEGDTMTVSKVKGEIMECVNDVYEDCTGANQEHQAAETVEEGPLSFNDLFADSIRNLNTMADEVGLGEIRTDNLRSEQLHEKSSSLQGRFTPRARGIGLSFRRDRMRGAPTEGSRVNYSAPLSPARQTFQAAAREHVSRTAGLLSIVHSISVNILLYLLMMFRAILMAMASIFKSVSVFSTSSTSQIFQKDWITAVDLSMGLIMLVIVFLSLCIELKVTGSRFFLKKDRVIDLFVLFPLLMLSITTGVHGLAMGGHEFFLSPLVHFVIITPLVMLFLIYRIHRVIGDRILLADTYGTLAHDEMRAIDFIWTTPYENGDDWLRSELEDLANGKQLRLHRFVTREKAGTQPGFPRNDGLVTNFGYVSLPRYLSSLLPWEEQFFAGRANSSLTL